MLEGIFQILLLKCPLRWPVSLQKNHRSVTFLLIILFTDYIRQVADYQFQRFMSELGEIKGYVARTNRTAEGSQLD
jgi:hypothetical protein